MHLFQITTTVEIIKIILIIFISVNVASVRERNIRPSNSNFSAKLVPTFADRRMSRSQRGGSPTAVISFF
jgi:hypothetical protein